MDEYRLGWINGRRWLYRWSGPDDYYAVVCPMSVCVPLPCFPTPRSCDMTKYVVKRFRTVRTWLHLDGYPPPNLQSSPYTDMYWVCDQKDATRFGSHSEAVLAAESVASVSDLSAYSVEMVEDTPPSARLETNTLTPEQAKQFLGTDSPGRAINQEHVDRLAEDMRESRFGERRSLDSIGMEQLRRMLEILTGETTTPADVVRYIDGLGRPEGGQASRPAEAPKLRTLAQLATEAIQVQDACNLSGLVHGWSRAVTELRANLPDASTEEVNRHPVNQLWAYKLYSLSCREDLVWDGYGAAYAECERLAGV